MLWLVGLTTACARIGYDLIDPDPDDHGPSQGAVSAQSGAGNGGSPMSLGGTRAGGNAGQATQAGNGGSTASVGGASVGGASVGGASVGGASVGGASVGGASVGGGSGVGGTDEKGQAGAGASPAGGGGETSPGAGASGTAGSDGRGGAGGTGANGGNAGSAGSAGSGGFCVPTESGVERCDGVDNDCSGLVDDASACSAGCTGHVFAGASYMYCSTNLTPGSAAAACSSENMRLARIDGSAENEFIRQFLVVDTWIGGSDTNLEGWWTWADGAVFWRGVASGSAPTGVYARFDVSEPNDNLGMSPEDCLVIRTNGYWNDKACSTTLPFMCQRY